MAKSKEQKQAEAVEKVTVVAQTDINATTTDDEVVKIEEGVIDGKKVDTLVIDETPKLVIDETAPKAFVKLKDGASCWGGGSLFISNSEIKEFNLSSTVLEGIRNGALIKCDKDGNPI